MSYQTAKDIYPKWTFSGWVVTNTPNTQLDPMFSPYGRNFRLNGASVMSRPWHQLLATLDWTGFPKGIGSYLRTSSTNDRLVVRQNVDWTHKLVSLTEAWVATNISTGSSITSDNRMIFTNIADDLYCMNWVDFGKLNWTTYTALNPTRVYSRYNGVAFVSGSPATITTNGSDFVTGGIFAWMVITISGSTSNNKSVTVATVTPDTITLISGDTLTNESVGLYTVTLTGATVAPSFSVYFAGCHWIGGFTTSGYTNQVWKSPNNDASSFTTTGSDVFTFPENVTGMVTTAQALFVFTKNTVHVADIGSQVQTSGVITFSFRALQTTEGSTNHASLVAVGSDVYYVSPANSINKIVRWGSIYWFEVISLSQRKYKGINNVAELLVLNQTLCHSQSFPQQNLIKFFFQQNGSTICDYCVVYDVVKDMFILDTNKYFYDEIYFHGNVYAVSNITPTVFQDEHGWDDYGSGIDFEYWTKAFDEWDYTLKKCYWESRTDVAFSELASLTQEIWVNSEVNVNGNFHGKMIDSITVDSSSIEDIEIWGIGTDETGTFPVGEEWVTYFDMYSLPILRTKGNLNARWKTIQFRFTSSVVGSQVQLRRLCYRVEVLPPITTDLTSAAVALLLTEAWAALITEIWNRIIT